jgi:hypothetical protein
MSVLVKTCIFVEVLKEQFNKHMYISKSLEI